jgi:hypothetical protein
MKFFLFSILTIMGSSAFSQDFGTELKTYFEDAKDAISIEDFPDASGKQIHNCSYYSHDWSDFTYTPYTTTKSPPVRKGRGPLFSDVVGKQYRKLILRDITGNDYDTSGIATVDVTDREITYKINSEVYIFRKSGPYMFFRYSSSGTYYGYCWLEKN